jgi:hypothetical protein
MFSERARFLYYSFMMIVYGNPPRNAHDLIQFFRDRAATLRNLRRLIVTKEKTTVLDVNGDGIEFPGLTYGNDVLDELLRELGVIFNPERLHDAKATPSGAKEFDLSGRWTWGHDRVL